MTTPDLPATLLADLRDVQPPMIAGILIGGCVAKLSRVLRSGTFPDGHVVPGSVMPWPMFSNWSEEDHHAVVVYLRHLKPIVHRIPDPVPGNAITIPVNIVVRKTTGMESTPTRTICSGKSYTESSTSA